MDSFEKPLGQTRGLIEEVKSAHRITPDFPIEVFNPHMQKILRGLKDPYGFPYDGLALNMLVAASGAIGNSVAVSFNGGVEGINLFAIQVAPSGGGKTPDQAFASKPLQVIDDVSQKNFDAIHAEFDHKLLQAKDRNARLPKEKKKLAQLVVKEFKDNWIKANGSLPKFNQIVFTNSTFEAVFKTLRDSPRGCCWISQEIMQVLDNFNRYSGGKGGDERMMLDFEKPSFIKISRSGTNDYATHSIIPKGFLSLLGGIQNDFVKELFKGGRDVSGFAARLLFSWPVYNDRPYYNESINISEEVRDQYKILWYRVVSRLYRVPYSPATDKDPEIKTTLTFSPEALQVVNKYLNENVIDIYNQKPDGVIQAYISKIEKKFMSIIGIMHSLDCAFDDEAIAQNVVISKELVERCCKLMDYFTLMWVKAYKDSKFGLTAKLTEKQDALYKELPDEFTSKQARKIALDRGIMSRQAVDKWLNNEKLNVYLTPIKDSEENVLRYIKTISHDEQR